MKSGRERPWSVMVARAEVPETGRRYELSADAEARDRVATVAGLGSLPRLEAALDVTRYGREGLRVSGNLSATVGQTCVVTLEPIENEVEEHVDLVFLPPGEQDADKKEIDVANDDVPETLVNGAVDLGAIVVEFLMLALDPYPRKPGVAFESPPGSDDGSNRPFAALAALKKGESGENG